MPTEAESLTIHSTRQQRQGAISACVSKLVGEGRDREQAVAICIRQADKAMGTKEARD